MTILSDTNKNIKFQCPVLGTKTSTKDKSRLFLVKFKGGETISRTYNFTLELISESP
jgi:hypothetical protein